VKRKRIEIRNNDRGELDEIVARKVDVHLEYMDDGQVWMRIGDLMVDLYTKRNAKIHALCQWDTPK
jgi:hypothetical protein